MSYVRRPAGHSLLRPALAGLAALAAAGGTCGAPGAADRPPAAGPAPAAPSPARSAGSAGASAAPAAPARVAPPALALPPALAGDDPAALARAADLVRRARDYERRALRPAPAAPAPAPASDAPAATDARPAAALDDSARQAYDAAAALAPDARDWLTLRRLSLEPDPLRRARLAATVATPAARDQLPVADAAARLRAGDLPSAAAALDAAGRPAAALAVRLRLAFAPAGGDGLAPATAQAPDRAALRAALVALVAAAPAGDTLPPGRAPTAESPTERARVAAVLLDSVFAPLAPAERLGVARALLRTGDGPGARLALRQTGDRFPGDTAAASARFLLAELTADDGDESAARAGYLRLARDLPGARLAPAAAVRAGILAMAAGDVRAAAEAFDLAAGRWPDAPEAGAARYWAGRAHAAAGDSASARARWTAAAADGGSSYYGWLAGRRLGRGAWTPLPGGAVARDPAADASARRAALCERLGLGAEAGWERDWLARWADTSAARLLAAAAAAVETGRPGPGIRLAARAVGDGPPPSADVWRLLYPLLYGGPLGREARAAGVDPALAAALVRQESNFTADAVSPAGARGLMQVMPAVGRALWRGPGTWDPALLFRPDVNLALGMRHLRAALGGWADPAYALAAYNAGAARVRRWQRQPGAADPELFVERIPYAETRDYVRVVLRNRALYRGLYAL